MSTACLLLHGLCGTPFEVSFIAAKIKEQGVCVQTPLLPGHGTQIEDIKSKRFADWLEFARASYLALSKEHERVVVGGFSMGGTLAALIASEFSCAGLFTISAPAFIYRVFPWQMADWRMPFMGILQHICPYPTFRKSSIKSRALAPFEGYEGLFFIPQVQSFSQGTALLRKRLQHITCPTLILHDLHDRLVFSESALLLAKGVSSKDVEVVFTNLDEKITSHHMLPTHLHTREFVSERVENFVVSRLK